MNIKLKYMIYLSYMLLIACNANQRKAITVSSQNEIVRLEINPDNHGWYYLNLTEDSLKNTFDTTHIKYNDERLCNATVKNANLCEYIVFDTFGKDVSTNMKLPAFFYGGNKKIIFKFYNPTEHESEKEKTWLPTSIFVDSLEKESLKKMRSLPRPNSK